MTEHNDMLCTSDADWQHYKNSVELTRANPFEDLKYQINHEIFEKATIPQSARASTTPKVEHRPSTSRYAASMQKWFGGIERTDNQLGRGGESIEDSDINREQLAHAHTINTLPLSTKVKAMVDGRLVWAVVSKPAEKGFIEVEKCELSLNDKWERTGASYLVDVMDVQKVGEFPEPHKLAEAWLHGILRGK